MINSSLKILYFFIIILFIIFVLSTYFSKNNILKIQKKIHSTHKEIDIKTYNLPVIKNDTGNVITYNSEGITEKKIKKRKIWELLK